MRTPFVAANWKMHKTVREALVYASSLRTELDGIADVDVVVAPPFTALHAVAAAFADTSIGVAGQDLYWETHGAFTGEVSAPMLREAGASYVIIGHSERRQLFGESDEAVNQKIRAAVDADLTPIVCVGETLAERQADQTLAVLDRQLEHGLAGVTSPAAERLVVAYEPVWAIGTGHQATPGQAQEAHRHIRDRLKTLIGAAAANGCRILYGGSVKPDTVEELAKQPDVDGALVGGASLDPSSFAQIVVRSRTATV